MSVSLKFERLDFHCEFLRDVTDGMPSPWKLLVGVVSQSFQDLIEVAEKIERAVQLVIWLGRRSVW